MLVGDEALQVAVAGELHRAHPALRDGLDPLVTGGFRSVVRGSIVLPPWCFPPWCLLPRCLPPWWPGGRHGARAELGHARHRDLAEVRDAGEGADPDAAVLEEIEQEVVDPLAAAFASKAFVEAVEVDDIQ